MMRNRAEKLLRCQVTETKRSETQNKLKHVNPQQSELITKHQPQYRKRREKKKHSTDRMTERKTTFYVESLKTCTRDWATAN